LGSAFFPEQSRYWGEEMPHYALVFFIIALIAGLLGFGVVASARQDFVLCFPGALRRGPDWSCFTRQDCLEALLVSTLKQLLLRGNPSAVERRTMATGLAAGANL
jgi:hypothetical protein